jgi:eukaryotic-like serine/threonine-protein kinase
VSSDPRIGSTLAGKYLLERVLGEGGMGVVYAARHLRIDRPVAIKFLHASYAKNRVSLERFFAEARAAGSLRHPNVIDVLDLDTEGDAPFMVLELLQGEPLSALLARRTRLSVDETLSILLPVLSALDAAHARGIVHRDLKPDNVFLAQEDGRLVPKLLDFGIAKLRDGSGIATHTGTAMGTPMYMAPEQARGEVRTMGPATDVWAMGVLAFECLTGRLPFDFDTSAGPLSFIALVVTATPHALRDFAPDVPAAISTAVDGALVRDAGARWPDAAAMRAVLRGEPVAASSTAPTLEVSTPGRTPVPHTRITPSETPERSGTMRIALALGVLLAGASAIGVAAWAWTRPSPETHAPPIAAPVSPVAAPLVVPSRVPPTPPPAPAPETPPEAPAAPAPRPPAARASRRVEPPPTEPREAPPSPTRTTERTQTRTGVWDPSSL